MLSGGWPLITVWFERMHPATSTALRYQTSFTPDPIRSAKRQCEYCHRLQGGQDHHDDATRRSSCNQVVEVDVTATKLIRCGNPVSLLSQSNMPAAAAAHDDAGGEGPGQGLLPCMVEPTMVLGCLALHCPQLRSLTFIAAVPAHTDDPGDHLLCSASTPPFSLTHTHPEHPHVPKAALRAKAQPSAEPGQEPRRTLCACPVPGQGCAPCCLTAV